MDHLLRAKNQLSCLNVDLYDKKQLIDFLTKYAKENGNSISGRNWGMKTSLAVKELYPNDIVIFNNGITSKEGHSYIMDLAKRREEFLQYYKEHSSPQRIANTIKIPRTETIRKTIHSKKIELCEKHNTHSIPEYIVVAEIIKEYGEEHYGL